MIACNGYEVYWQPLNPINRPWSSAKGPTIPDPPEQPAWLKDVLRRFMMYVELKRRMRRMKRHMMPNTVFGVPVVYEQ